MILHGSGSGEDQLPLRDGKIGARKGEEVVEQHPFEGVIPNMERRYRDTRIGRGARGSGALSQRAALP